jgi:hypothetical protein
MISQIELPKRNFVQFYRGVKGAFIFFVSSYLIIIVCLLSTATTDMSDLWLVIAGWTLIVSWILYSGYAENQRLINSLEKSDVLNFLSRQGFQLKEKRMFFHYDLNFEGRLEECFIIAAITKRQGLFWNKYYLYLLGLTDDKLKLVETGYSDRIGFKEYREPILLTTSPDTKSKLDEALSQFIIELRTKD